MAADRRRKDANWLVAGESGEIWGTVRQGAILATLMDIRDEMKALNSHLRCSNFVRIPRILDRISANTHKPKKRKKAL